MSSYTYIEMMMKEDGLLCLMCAVCARARTALMPHRVSVVHHTMYILM